MKISWLAAIALVFIASLLIFPFVIVYSFFTGHIAIAAAFFATSLFWFPALFLILVGLAMWLFWKSIPIWTQVMLSVVILVIGLVLTEAVIGIAIDVLAVLGFSFTVLELVSGGGKGKHRMLRGGIG